MMAAADLEAKLRLEKEALQTANKLLGMPPDEVLVGGRQEIARVFGAEHAIIYVKDPARQDLYARAKSGAEVKEARYPIAPNSFAGFVALKSRPLRLANASDPKELAQVDPALRPAAEEKGPMKARQVLAVPMGSGADLVGVIELRNRKDGKPFGPVEESGLAEIARVLAAFFKASFRPEGPANRWAYLLSTNRVSPENLDQAIEMALQKKCSVETVLLQHFRVPAAEIAKSLRDFAGADYVPFMDGVPPPKELVGRIPVDYCTRANVVPYKREGSRAVILMENPRDVMALDGVQRSLPEYQVVPKISSRDDIRRYIDQFYGTRLMASGADSVGVLIEEVQRQELTPEETTREEPSESDHGIVRLVNKLIEDAHSREASDIHIEPYPHSDLIVRFRVDGVCHEYSRFPNHFARPIISRLKIMSGLDIAERRLPQDGKILFKKYGPLDLELRVATLPTAGGVEDVVLRLLSSALPVSLDGLGMEPTALEDLRRIVSEPYGIFLCVGPTGSGKTTTLHAALAFLNTTDRKIWTAEDPVEITQAGLRQIQVMSKIGLTFERALRAFLRADPDVIMIGEMRDVETANAAIEASLTGHMVFSTLHTNSAPETVTRLLEMGLDPYAFGDSLMGILAQRLVRKLCPHCRQETDGSEAASLLREVGMKPGQAKLYKPGGCADCNRTGYRGRAAIMELLKIDEETRRLIHRKAPSAEIRAAGIKNGLKSLKQDGVRKVLAGITDANEVRSVCL